MPNSPLTTVFDEDLLSRFLGDLKNPYVKDRNDLVQVQGSVDEPLRTIIHSLLDIPDRIQPLFPIWDLLIEPRARHLTCQQAKAANTYFRLLIQELNVFWILAVHYLVHAHTLDNTAPLPANRTEAAALWKTPDKPTDNNHNPDPSGHIHIHFLVGLYLYPEELLEEGPDFTLRVEDEGIVLRVVLRTEPPPFIFFKAMQDPETGEITDLEAWEKISTRQLADVPGMAKRFRRHHQQNIRRAHTIIWPRDFLSVMTALDDLQDPDRYKLMTPFYQDYLTHEAALDLPQNRQGLRRIAKNPIHPCRELAQTIDTLPESETLFPIGDYLNRQSVDFSLFARFKRVDPDRQFKPDEISNDMINALIQYNHFLQNQTLCTWLHHLNIYVLSAVSKTPQPHLDKSTLRAKARDTRDVQAFDFFERGPDFEVSFDEEGNLFLVTEKLYHNIETTTLWNYVTVQEANQKGLTFDLKPFSFHVTWLTEVLDPLRPW